MALFSIWITRRLPPEIKRMFCRFDNESIGDANYNGLENFFQLNDEFYCVWIDSVLTLWYSKGGKKLRFILENIIAFSFIILRQFYRSSCPSQPQEMTRMFRIIQQRQHRTGYLICPREFFFFNSMVKFYCIWIDFGVLHLDWFGKFTVLLELVNSNYWKKRK